MTRDGFKVSVKSYSKYEWASVGTLILALLLGAILASYVEDRVERTGFDAICITVLAISFPIFAIFVFYGIIRYPRQKLLQLNLTCPSCGKGLVGLSSQVVIATGRCGFCGKQVLDSDEQE